MTQSKTRSAARPATRRSRGPSRPQPIRRTVTTRQRAEPVERRRGAKGSPSGFQRVPFFVVLMVVTCLSLLGLTMVLSASSVTSLTRSGSPWGEFKSQVLWLGLGFGAMASTTVLNHNILRKLTLPGLVVSFLLLVGVLVPGLGVSWKGAQRWIRLGPIQFQPSELAKLALVIYAAHVLSRSNIVDVGRSVKPIVAVLIVFGGLILLEPNLGTTIIVFSIAVVVLFASGAPFRVIGALSGVSVAGATMLAYLASYRRRRLFAFLDPWDDPLGDGYQTIQSLVSVANGGVNGVGIGASRGKFGFLPEAHNDFVFAVTAEEFGLVGACVVVLGYVVFGMAALTVARQADRFGALLVIGIMTWVLVQAFINIGAVLGVMPITGVPLPFMSAGGTSLVTTMAGVGVILSVARSVR